MTTADYYGAALVAVGLFVFVYSSAVEREGGASARELDAPADDGDATAAAALLPDEGARWR